MKPSFFIHRRAVVGSTFFKRIVENTLDPAHPDRFGNTARKNLLASSLRATDEALFASHMFHLMRAELRSRIYEDMNLISLYFEVEAWSSILFGMILQSLPDPTIRNENGDTPMQQLLQSSLRENNVGLYKTHFLMIMRSSMHFNSNRRILSWVCNIMV